MCSLTSFSYRNTVRTFRYNLLVAGMPWKRISKIFHNFLDCWLPGYSIASVPRLETICSAVNGLFVNLHRESVHHFLTAATSCWNFCSSASKFDMLSNLMLLVRIKFGGRSGESTAEMAGPRAPAPPRGG